MGISLKKNWKSSLKVDTIDIKNSNLIHTSFLFNYDYFYHITNISFQIENRYTSVLNLFSIFFCTIFFHPSKTLCYIQIYFITGLYSLLATPIRIQNQMTCPWTEPSDAGQSDRSSASIIKSRFHQNNFKPCLVILSWRKVLQ